tara:strand:- start:3659 stop:4126 length:468 start_codon:yes stop_codon:yes gene_type:complete
MNENKKIIMLKKTDQEKKSDYSNMQEISFINMLYLNQEFLEENNVKKKIRKKLSSYKSQDKKKERYIDKEFITETEVVEKLFLSQLKCYYCSCHVYLFYNNNRQDSQWTLERLDNKILHSNKNTVVSCLKCNLKRRTSNSKKFLFTKKMNLIKKL